MPGSPLLPLYPYSSSSSVTGFRHGEVSGEYPSLHDAEPTLDPSRSGPTIRNKGLVSVTREDAQSSSYGTSYGDMHCFPRSPTVCPPFLTISEFDPGLRHLLGGTVSPAVASTPSPTTTTTTAMKTSMYPASSSPPLVQQQLYRYLDDSEAEAVTDIVVGGGVGELEVECPETTNVVVAGGDDQELVEDLSETV